MSGIGPWGTAVDLNTVQKRIGRLKKFLFNNQVTSFKALSTTILGDLTALNTLIQAVSAANQLPADPTLQIYDSVYQTADTNSYDET